MAYSLEAFIPRGINDPAMGNIEKAGLEFVGTWIEGRKNI
jgi:hypothetical protein